MAASELRTEILRGIAYLNPPKDLREELDRLIAIAAVGATANQLRSMVENIYKRKAFSCKGPFWEPGELVYRARRMDTKPKQLSEISYPPSRVVKCGRVNREGQPIFYGTHGSLAPCLFECDAKPGDHFAIGKWTLQSRQVFAQVGFSKKLNLTRPNRLYPSLFIDDQENPTHQILKDWQCDVVTRPITGADDEWIYRLSTALAELVLQLPLSAELQKQLGQKFPAGVIYPSVASNTFGDNVAIKPEFIDNDFRFDAAIWVEVEDIVYGADIRSHYQTSGKLKAIDVGFCDEAGNLEWHPHPKNSPVFSRYPARRR